MGEDDQEWIEGNVRRSSFGGFSIGSKKKKPKRRSGRLVSLKTRWEEFNGPQASDQLSLAL